MGKTYQCFLTHIKWPFLRWSLNPLSNKTLKWPLPICIHSFMSHRNFAHTLFNAPLGFCAYFPFSNSPSRTRLCHMVMLNKVQWLNEGRKQEDFGIRCTTKKKYICWACWRSCKSENRAPKASSEDAIEQAVYCVTSRQLDWGLVVVGR